MTSNEAHVERYVKAVASEVLDARNDVTIVTYEPLGAFEPLRDSIRAARFTVPFEKVPTPIVVHSDGRDEGIEHPSIARKPYQGVMLADRIKSLDLSYGYRQESPNARLVPSHLQAIAFTHETDPHRYPEAERATSTLLNALATNETPLTIRFENIDLRSLIPYGPLDVFVQQLYSTTKHDRDLKAQRNEIMVNAPNKAHAVRALDERIRDSVFKTIQAF